MLWAIIVVLLLLWFLGFAFTHIGNLLFLLIAAAVVLFVYELATGRRP